jgi:hypothetical protein
MVGGGSGGNVDDKKFMPIFDAKSCGESDENKCWTPMPVGGVLKTLYVSLENTPANGKGWRFILRKNGADTLFFCDIAAGDFSCQNLVGSVAYGAGDLMSVRVITTPGLGKPDGSVARYTALYDSTT